MREVTSGRGVGFFRIVIFADLLLDSNATNNAATIAFVNNTLDYYIDRASIP